MAVADLAAAARARRNVKSLTTLLNFVALTDQLTNTWDTFVTRVAAPDPGAYGGRRARRGGRYQAFVSPHIADRDFAFVAETAEDLQAGTVALHDLHALGLQLVQTFERQITNYNASSVSPPHVP